MTPVLVVIASTLGWPVLELGVFWLRFRHLPPNGAAEALVFVPMGLVAGVIAAVLMLRAADSRQRRFVLWGYLVASPVAFLGALLGGLVIAGAWGPLVTGAIPLGVGCLIGFVAGRPRAGEAA